MKNIIVLGSSGSVGLQTLDIAYAMRDSINVIGLSCASKIETLKNQIEKFKPRAVCINGAENRQALVKWIGQNNYKTEVLEGQEGLEELVSLDGADMIVCAVVGSAGFRPLLKAIKLGKHIALANKEALVMGGTAIMELAQKYNATIIPVDSEHSAIFQCLHGQQKRCVNKLLLTASGGPFYKYDGDFSAITPAQALAHPTWKMGPKITVDSATLMNKGLELIEASLLFDIVPTDIEIVIHPQSIVHSMVEFVDSCVLAQLSNADMTLPIQYALTYPDRLKSTVKRLKLPDIKTLEFFKPDFVKFPCLNLAIQCVNYGGVMPTVMSAADESAVYAFLKGQVLFTDIVKIIEETVDSYSRSNRIDIENMQAAYIWALDFAQKAAIKRSKKL
jgi:1-deoxy-D-xylulose-5-phosphate reductoisomerase